MKKLVAVLFIMLCTTLALSADKPNPADFTIRVHISASSIQHLYGNGLPVLTVEAILNGKNIELSGFAEHFNDSGHKSGNNFMLLTPGDYQARLIKDVHNSDNTAIHQEYDILLTDGIVWHCITTGISE